MVNAYIFYIFMSKLGYQQELYLVILVKINKNSKVSFYNTILLFF